MSDAERRYEDAISRRNRTWLAYQDALQWAEGDNTPIGTPSHLRGLVNDAQHDWEWACRDLVRERVIFREVSHAR